MFRLDPKQMILDHAAGGVSPRRGKTSLTEAAEQILAAPVEPTISGAVIVGVAQAIEALLLATLGLAIYGSYVGWGQEAFYVPVILGAVLFANIMLNAARAHRIAVYRTVIQQNGRVLAAWSMVMVALAFLAFFSKASDVVRVERYLRKGRARD